jgi:hypothetical protein
MEPQFDLNGDKHFVPLLIPCIALGLMLVAAEALESLTACCFSGVRDLHSVYE